MYQNIGVAGGSGFLGKSLIAILAKSKHKIKILCRNYDQAKSLKILGEPGQITIIRGNINNKDDVEDFVKGCDVIINLVAVFFEYGSQNFNNIHVLAPKILAIAAKNSDVKHFVQVSNIGADKSSISNSLKSRGFGEFEIKKVYPNSTIIRPSLIFGENDAFFYRFEKMSKFSPFLPLIDGGKSLFQPVYVNDVSLAISKIIEQPNLHGHIYELGGPKIYSFKELIKYLLATINRKRILLNFNGNLLFFPAFIMSYYPFPVITPDQIKTLKLDNIINAKHKTFKDLKIIPFELEKIMPPYLSKFKN